MCLSWLVDTISFCKGLIWTAIATVAEVPPAVRLDNPYPLLSIDFYYTLGDDCFKFEW